MSNSTPITTTPACDSFGRFVEGVDLASASTEQIDQLRQLLFDNGVLFFRDQKLDPEAHIALAENMGDIVVNRYFTPVPDFPKVAQVVTEPDQDWVIGEKWHTDHSYDAAPALGSILYAIQVPPKGGNTRFAGVQAAYDALDPAMKERLEGLQARHESAHVFAPSEEMRMEQAEQRDDADYKARAVSYPEAVHPVVLAHPETGRKGLYVNPEFTTSIVGMEEEESKALLEELFDHIMQPRFVYEFEWEPGSVAIWDNRATWHQAANDYQGHRRHMHRITLDGVPLTPSSSTSASSAQETAIA